MTEVQYISDSNGRPIGVIVPIDVWEKIEMGEIAKPASRLKSLFKKTQSLPKLQSISDDEILREIEAYRNSK